MEKVVKLLWKWKEKIRFFREQFWIVGRIPAVAIAEVEIVPTLLVRFVTTLTLPYTNNDKGITGTSYLYFGQDTTDLNMTSKCTVQGVR